MMRSCSRGHGALAALGVAMLLLAGCAGLPLRSPEAPAAVAAPLAGRTLVVHLSSDPVERALYEDELANRLARRGIEPIRSYALIEAPLLPNSDDALSQVARDAGAGTVLSNVVLSGPRGPQIANEPFAAWGWYFDRGLGHYRSLAISRSEDLLGLLDIAESRLNDAATGKTLWSATTRAQLLATTTAERAEDFADMIILSLEKQGLLEPPADKPGGSWPSRR